MKIVLKKNEWHRLIEGGTSEENTTYQFNAIKQGLRWCDYGDSYVPDNQNIKGALPRYLNFSFKIIKVNEDNVVLEVSGDAGGDAKEDFSGFTPKQVTISLNDEKNFSIKTRDKGIIYSLILLSDDEKQERMPFYKFNHLISMNVNSDKVKTSIYAPLIYEMEDKYYNAAVSFLQNGTITHLKSGEISIADILSGYWLTQKHEGEHYLEALLILNNIEKAGIERAWEIFNPYVIE